MFAYCNNNPAIAADNNGEWLNVVIGAVVGGVISAASAAIQGRSTSEIIVSGLCGAVAGGLAATGLGGIAMQIGVGAATSFVSSGVQNYNDVRNGKKTVGAAIVSTLSDTAIGGLFGAYGYNGSGALKESCRLTKQLFASGKKLISNVVHPAVKKAAQNTAQSIGEYFGKQAISNAVDGVASSVISYGTNKVTGLYYEYYSK